MTPLPTVPLSAVPLSAVTITDEFWAPRREVVRTRTIPQQYRQLAEAGHLDALRLDWKPGDDKEPHIFWESDVAKWIEAASNTLVHHPDPHLDAALDQVIGLVAGAQGDDGYLNVHFTVVKPGLRFTDLRDAHELYCLGHLVEAAVAHHRATGKTSLLDIVLGYLELVRREFGEGGVAAHGYDGHEEIELALVKLFDLTGDRTHLDLAAQFVNDRGTKPFFFEDEARRRGDDGFFARYFPRRPEEAERHRQYSQSHLPVREQDEAVGHSVRAMYLYSAMADLAARLGDDGLRAACERLWTSVVDRKMYVTGGIGADASIEGFRGDHELPNDASYNETCASIGLVMWAWRMGLLTGEGRYGDVAELALHNTVLAGASSDGTHYFYGNPMQSDGEHARQEWFGVACCPPNYARLLTSLESYAFATGGDEVVVTLFIGGEVRVDLDEGPVRLSVETRYPWEGQVRVRVEDAARFTLAVRVPAWANGATATVNGERIDVDALVDRGYLRVHRDWAAGDELVLELPLVAERLWADPAVSADTGLVAVRRGPLVLCAEMRGDEPAAGSLVLGRDALFTDGWDDELDVAVVEATAMADHWPEDADGLYRVTGPDQVAIQVRLVPYFAWGNRGPSSMRVWLREGPSSRA
ncbi:glycoside hydrolase family 127 protein [Aestuariimicrobium ganziense]|uniref:glycoside hydrolase family 127 protein n=1 Tax=Aestuariimicrobium ganziense TaxID=2773677 RepID=UPI001945A820|nr:beta-L-arabinofuranosidase domain-containing protein [Aestuariimicrobium ganziense]